MNWHIGQEIVCINAKDTLGLKEGEIYKIKGLSKVCCCIRIDVGLRYGVYDTATCFMCNAKHKHDGINWKNEYRFAPLEYDQNAIEELLENTLVKTN